MRLYHVLLLVALLVAVSEAFSPNSEQAQAVIEPAVRVSRSLRTAKTTAETAGEEDEERAALDTVKEFVQRLQLRALAKKVVPAEAKELAVFKQLFSRGKDPADVAKMIGLSARGEGPGFPLFSRYQSYYIKHSGTNHIGLTLHG